MAPCSVARSGPPHVRLALPGIALLAGLSACAPPRHVYRPATPAMQVPVQLREYAPPGPPDDPWRPYIAEAAARFGVPETWIREVMRRESDGREYLDGSPITSSKGAMGLMQVMPETYEEIRLRYGLGADPYHPHDNVLAGTAYIREMYDRFGAPGFLAAYNAGPRRLEDRLFGGRPLPAETIAYVAAVAPRLGMPAAYASAVPEVSADDLNRSSLAGVFPGAATAAGAWIPAAGHAVADADTSADDLNRKVLRGALSPAPAAASAFTSSLVPSDTGAASETSADELNRRVLAAGSPTGTAAGGWSVRVRSGP